MTELKPPFFSIVIPSFNSDKFIAQTLQSVLEQEFSNWEVLLIDNNSSDGTDEIVKSFFDKRIRKFKINNNGSISKSRNLGIKEARGEWIAFLDADDWWEPSKLFKCQEKIKDGIDFIYHDLSVISQNKQHKDLVCRQLKNPGIIDLIMNGNPIAASSVVVRKSLLEEIGYMDENPSLIKTGDYNTWLKIARKTNSFLHIPKKLGFYRIHDKNVSNDSILQPTLEAINEFLILLTDSQKTKIKINITYTQARIRFLNKNYQKALPDLLQVVKYGSFPKKIKSLLMLFRVCFAK